MGKIQNALDKLKGSAPEGALPGSERPAPAYRPPVQQSRYGIRYTDTIEIDWAALSNNGLLPERAATKAISQQYRRIKRPLLRQLFGTYPIDSDESGRVLLIASAGRGEGKTFTSLNLALAIAIEPELQVLLVDGDAPKQNLTIALGLQDRPGLLDLAEDASLDPASCVCSTGDQKLFVLPAGGRRNNAPELLGSSRLQKVIGRIATESGPCVVVIDSPPVMLANEARALSSAADHTLFVVKAGSTNADVVDTALQSLGSTSNVSMLLNQASNVSGSGYHYGADRGYDYASEAEQGSETRED